MSGVHEVIFDDKSLKMGDVKFVIAYYKQTKFSHLRCLWQNKIYHIDL